MESGSAPRQRLALLVKSGSFADILLALSFAGIAAAADQDVVMFFTNDAARRLKVGGFADIDSPGSAESDFVERAAALGFRDLGAMLRDVKATGRVRVYLCSRGARLWDIDADSMIPEVDSIMGTATFLLDEARRAQTVLTI